MPSMLRVLFMLCVSASLSFAGEKTSGWQPKLRIGPERIILTDGIQPRGWRTKSGAIVVQAHLTIPPGFKMPAKNQPVGLPGTVVSRDKGESWTLWKAKPEQGVGPDTEGAAALLSDGTVVVLGTFTGPADREGNLQGSLWTSRDDFKTVTGPLAVEIHVPDIKRDGGFDDAGKPSTSLFICRTMLELPGGDLLCTAYGWFQEDRTPSTYEPKMNKFRSILLRSSDRGRHWKYVSTVAVDPKIGSEGFCEPVLARVSRGAKAGRLVCLMRTGTDNCQLYQAASGDEGETWTKPSPGPLFGVFPDMHELSDGTLVAVSGRRMFGGDRGQRRYHLTFSRDAGTTWCAPIALPATEPYALTMPGAKPGDHISTNYAALFELEPNVLLVVYDVGTWTTSVRYIASRRIVIE